MLESSAPFVLFDYFRVPHERGEGAGELSGLVRVGVAGKACALYWPGAALLEGRALRADLYRLGSIRLPGRVLDENEIRALVASLPGRWMPAEVVRDASGRPVSDVWRSEDGGALLPFDPNEVVASFWTERYLELGSRARAARAASAARRAYYVA